MYGHLSLLVLADPTHDEMLEVDMLIGSEFYWAFVCGEVIRGDVGPVALKTKLGWVLSGPAEVFPPEHTANLITVCTLTIGEEDEQLNATMQP